MREPALSLALEVEGAGVVFASVLAAGATDLELAVAGGPHRGDGAGLVGVCRLGAAGEPVVKGVEVNVGEDRGSVGQAVRCLLIHQAFAGPGDAGGTRHYEIARRLAERGHRFAIVTSTISYLSGADRGAGPRDRS